MRETFARVLLLAVPLLVVFGASCGPGGPVSDGDGSADIGSDTGGGDGIGGTDTGVRPDTAADTVDGDDVDDFDTSGDADVADGDDGGRPDSEFVTVDPEEPRFLLRGEPFYFVGTNLFWMAQQHVYENLAVVDDSLDMCQEMGLRVIRIWGFADGHQWTNPDDPAIMQPEAGVYNEDAFESLDYVLAEAEKHDVKVIVPLVNYWEDYGGMLQYARWTGGSSYEHFYTDTAARELYKDYVRHMLTRVNTITGEEYRNDPTIMAWELANEAQAHFDGDAEDGTLESWYREMAAHVRSLDSNHLVATGEEGFGVSAYSEQYSDSYTNTYVIRGTPGTSYVDNTTLSEISYGGAHFYPETYGLSSPVEDGRRWITDHAEIAREQGKPFVLGEFGNPDRSVYADWLQVIENQDVAGSLMWQIVPASRGRENSMTIVYPDDSNLVEIFEAHADHMNAKR